MEKNIVTYKYKIGAKERQTKNGHNSFLVFFTGLSGSGKSTIANALEQKLFEKDIRTYILDGDNVRKGINKDLSFSAEDRSENNRRIGEMAKLFIDSGIVVMAAFVSPYRKDREMIKNTVGPENYIEVFVNTSLEECERRDAKGLYRKSRLGEIKNMTGISAPYEVPKNPNVTLTHLDSVEEAVNKVYHNIIDKLKIDNK